MKPEALHAKPKPTGAPATTGGYAEVLRIAWPLVISTGSFTLMTFCDRLFLAWHSPVSIQAALPAGILSFACISGFMALAAFAGTFVAQFPGAGDGRGCVRAAVQGMILALVSWPLLIALIPVGRVVLSHSGHSPNVLAAELPYFSLLMAGGLGPPLAAAAGSFFTGRGQTRIPMITNVLANMINIALDYGLIFGAWGMPRLGMQGAAWATVISGMISPALLILIMFSAPVARRYHTRAQLVLDRQLLWRMIRFGTPAGIHMSLDISAFAVFVVLTARMDPVSLAASNIALSINLLAFLPLVGLGIAAGVLVGQYQGAQRSRDAARTGWTALKLGWIYMAVIGSSFILIPELYYRLFASQAPADFSAATLLGTGRRLLWIMTLWGFADTCNMVLGNALKGAGDTRFVMWYSVAAAWLVLAGGQLVLVVWLHAGIVTAWLWTALYILILALGYLWRFQSGTWKQIRLIAPGAAAMSQGPGAEALLATEP